MKAKFSEFTIIWTVDNKRWIFEIISPTRNHTLPFQIRCTKWFSRGEKGWLIGSGWFCRVRKSQKTTQHLFFLKAESHTRCNTYHHAAFLPRQTCVLKLRGAPGGPQQRARLAQGSFLRTERSPPAGHDLEQRGGSLGPSLNGEEPTVSTLSRWGKAASVLTEWAAEKAGQRNGRSWGRLAPPAGDCRQDDGSKGTLATRRREDQG